MPQDVAETGMQTVVSARADTPPHGLLPVPDGLFGLVVSRDHLGPSRA
jgi:hypothetical protein